MTSSPCTPVQLIAECDDLGIRLLPTGNNGLTIDAPRDALTPILLARLKASKAALLTLLRPSPFCDVDASNDQPAPAVPEEAQQEVCPCGSKFWQDVQIHGGKSIRRDCGRCGRFIGFPIWNGADTGHKGQQPT